MKKITVSLLGLALLFLGTLAQAASFDPATGTITFPATQARNLRITNQGSVPGLSWSVHELTAYAPSCLATQLPPVGVGFSGHCVWVSTETAMMERGTHPSEDPQIMPVQSVFDRHPNNPLLLPKDAPIPCKSICNPAAARVGDEVLLLTRVIDDRDLSQLFVARSKDGVSGWRFDTQPLLAPAEQKDGGGENEWYDTLGCEDPRVTFLPERAGYLIAYVGYSPFGAGVCLAATSDFQTAERLGIIIPPYDKDAVLFPRHIGGRYLILHRPTINGLENIWLMESDDLLHWGRPVCILQKGETGWDSGKIGAGPPPIETPEGWLLIFHGAEQTPQGWVYRVGLALLDLDDPTQVIARTKMPVFEPEAPYERGGVKPGIVFPTGTVLSGDTLLMYYGAADVGIALATAPVSRLLEAVRAG